MGTFPSDELSRQKSLGTLLFRVENCQSPSEAQRLIEEIAQWFTQHSEPELLKRVFTELMRECVRSFEPELTVPDELKEMQTMISTMAQRWKERSEGQWKQEWHRAALAQGKAETLARLLTKRFGPLPSAIEKRVSTASLETLEQWIDRIIDAPNLSAVFE